MISMVTRSALSVVENNLRTDNVKLSIPGLETSVPIFIHRLFSGKLARAGKYTPSRSNCRKARDVTPTFIPLHGHSTTSASFF